MRRVDNASQNGSQRGLLFTAGLYLSLLLLASCAGRTPAQTGHDAVTFLLESSPANLDPRVGADASSQYLDSLIFSSLVARDDHMDIVPDLATSWEQPDPVTYVLHLRRGVRFHDGHRLTAADVKYTFDSVLSGQIKTPKRGSFRLVQSVEARDDATIIFHLREPYASFLFSFVRPAIGIVPRGAGAEMAIHPMGSGPFRFVSARPDEEIVLERNPDYFGEPPKIRLLSFRVVPDATTRALELRKGSADIALDSLAPDMASVLTSDSRLALEEKPGTNITYIGVNFDDKLLARRDVRQALAFAMDRDALIRYLLRGEARAAASLLPPSHWAFEPEVTGYNYDPQRAEHLLDAANLPRGPDGIRLHLALKTSTEESARVLAGALQEEWGRIGVRLEIRPLEIGTLLADVNRGSFQLSLLRWIGANSDPDIFNFVFNSRMTPPAGANRGNYRNPDLDDLLDRARVEPDREVRRALYSQVQKIVAVDQPYLLLWYPDRVCVYNRRIAGLRITPAGGYDFLDSISLRGD
jgi:peptide/nickel transport system substrate-binding protein